MKIFSIILMVISPTAAFAAWETNMPRGVTPTSEIAYDLHMLIFYITVVIGILVFGAMLYSGKKAAEVTDQKIKEFENKIPK